MGIRRIGTARRCLSPRHRTLRAFAHAVAVMLPACLALALVGIVTPVSADESPIRPVASAAPYGVGTQSVMDALQGRLAASAGGRYVVAAGLDGSMPTTGEARVLAIRIAFPEGLSDCDAEPVGFGANDTLDNLQSAIGEHVDGTRPVSLAPFPCECLTRYYLRSSYGQLHISGDAYDYEARLPRDAYDGRLTNLAVEAIDAIDAQVDLADYDGNGDGIIDCVCMRVAGPAEDPSSDWWSRATYASGMVDAPVGQVPTPTFDGRHLGSLVVLHRQPGMTVGVKTLIHEVGHVLGLPDYYSVLGQDSDSRNPEDGILEGGDDRDEVGGESMPGGIGAHDMMNDNSGDHNGYSKWMLGWLGDRDVIKVTCDADGHAVATLGGEVVQVDDDAEDGHVLLPIGTLTGDGEEDAPRIVAVYPRGDDGHMGPLSDFYLLQYSSFTGNQQQCGMGTQTAADSFLDIVVGGFQMFRIQGRLAKGQGMRLGHNDRVDPRHDQLIEVVNPSERTDGNIALPSLTVGFGWNPIGPLQGLPEPAMTAMSVSISDGVMREGAEVTPDTFPSTNFREDRATGRTGICVRVVRAEDRRGTVEVWYE